jgi:hypothetical protein
MEAFRSEEDQDEKSELRRFAARDVLTRLKSSRIETSKIKITDNFLMMLLGPAAVEKKFEIVNLKQVAMRRFIVKSR